jgi:transcriptional regulator with XRE-family HTH domain
MTPFGLKLRELRRAKGVSQKEMAGALGISAAYLSALEHGRRGTPTWVMVQKMIGYFNIIWDDAEELQRLAETSHPRVVIDTSGLSPRATEFANRLSKDISQLTEKDIEGFLSQLDAVLERTKQA